MLGTEIRDLRELRGFSRARVVEETGLSKETLKNLEAGLQYPSLRTLETLARCLHMNVVIGPDETIIEPLD